MTKYDFSMTKYDLSMTKYKFSYFVKTIYNLSRQNMVFLTSYFVIDIYIILEYLYLNWTSSCSDYRTGDT